MILILCIVGWVLFIWTFVANFFRAAEPSGREVATRIKQNLHDHWPPLPPDPGTGCAIAIRDWARARADWIQEEWEV